MAYERNHRLVAVAAQHHAVDVRRRSRIAGFRQSDGQVIAETAAVEHAALTENAVARQSRILERQVRHGVHRVGDDDEVRIGRELQSLIDDALDDLRVDADQILAAHARLARHAGRDDDDLGSRRRGVAVRIVRQSRDALHRRVKVQHVRRLHDVDGLALGHALLDVNEDDLAAERLRCKDVRNGSSDITCTNNCHFHVKSASF